jgi:4-aminobutyrate aminotransferase-like enzyme
MGKGMGGGMPVGALQPHQDDGLIDNPKLGTHNNLGGHPVIAAACLATLKEITETDLMQQAIEKEMLFRSLLVHPLIEKLEERINVLAMTSSPDITNQVILKCQDRGLILFWLLLKVVPYALHLL